MSRPSPDSVYSRVLSSTGDSISAPWLHTTVTVAEASSSRQLMSFRRACSRSKPNFFHVEEKYLSLSVGARHTFKYKSPPRRSSSSTVQERSLPVCKSKMAQASSATRNSSPSSSLMETAPAARGSASQGTFASGICAQATLWPRSAQRVSKASLTSISRKNSPVPFEASGRAIFFSPPGATPLRSSRPCAMGSPSRVSFQAASRWSRPWNT